MGSENGGVWMLRPQTEPLAQDVEVNVPRIGVSLSYDCEKWISLGKFVELLGVHNLELETEADTLRNLCYFLSSSAATFKHLSSVSAEDISLSAAVGDREVYIYYDDLVALHGLLFQKLAYHIPIFSADNEFAECHSAFPSTLQELRVTVLTLRCCIWLLPLMELFDTGLRNSMRVGLGKLLQKLCSPMELCLSPSGLCSSEPFRAPIICALLEVFIDELLCRSKIELLLVQDGGLAIGTRSTSQLTLEATIAHVMLCAHVPHGLHKPRARVCELSLQSAVMLLDVVITDNAPRYLLSHVVRIVSQALEDSMCISDNCHFTTKIRHEKKWFSQFLISGYTNSVENCKFDKNYVPDSLSQQVCLWLVFAVLERGVSLYLKFASAPHLASFVSSLDSGIYPSAAISNTLLASCLWKDGCHLGTMCQECEVALESMFSDATSRKGLEECMDRSYSHDHEHIQGHEPGQKSDSVLKALYSNGNMECLSGTRCCGRERCIAPVWEEDHSMLIADVLHLMHSALNLITGKARLTLQNCRDGVEHGMTREEIDDIWLGVIGSFHQCLPSAGDTAVAGSVGHVLVFFTDMLYYETETSISDKKLREYLELLESLSISLLMEHTWRKSTSLPQLFGSKFRENESLSPGCYARKVVSLLQGFLEEPDLPEILGGNAVSIILQVNCFLNDFCEYIDKVLATNDWREHIPASGRRVARNRSKILQEAVLCDRHPTSHEKCEPVQHRPSPADAEGQQSQDKERESAEHNPGPAIVSSGKQKLRPSTLLVLQKLMKHRRHRTKPHCISSEREPEVVGCEGRPVRKCRRVSEDETTDIPTEADGNQFVAEVLLLEKMSENFDDLNDFIVCKQGRSYTRWLNRRTKFRRRMRTREIWKRSEDKLKLLSMLNIV